MSYSYDTLFLLFMLYSIMGWLLEVTCKLIEKHKFINRGFLIGPYCPIYGHGAILMILLLSKYQSDPLLLFTMSIVICSILEYFTSYIMEKIFKARWWDYSRRKFNINGRICLETMIPFGLLGMLIIYVVNPVFVNLIARLSPNLTYTLAVILSAIYIADNIISFKIIYKFRSSIKLHEKDSTEQISKLVKEEFLNRNILYKRLIKAFPNFKGRKEYLIELRNRINSKLEKTNK